MHKYGKGYTGGFGNSYDGFKETLGGFGDNHGYGDFHMGDPNEGDYSHRGSHSKSMGMDWGMGW